MAEKMAKAIDGFYPYFWHKFKLSPVNYAEGPQCEKWVKDLREAVLVHGIVSLWQWRPFLDKILLKNRFSFKTYASYTFFVISTTVEGLSTRHESFMTFCSLVTAIAAYVHDKGHHDFLEYCPDILMVIFEEKFLKKPDGIQIWEKLEDHLNQYKYSEAYKMVEQTIKGNPFADKVYKLEFVTSIKEKIGSKISIENAAVYCQIAKVEKRFRTRKSQKLSFIEDWERKISVGEESTSVVKGTGVAVSKSNSSSQRENVDEIEILESKQSLSIEENNYINSRQESLQSEQTLRNDTNTFIISHSKESPVLHPIPVITSNRNSPFQMEPSRQNVEEAKIPENVQSLSVVKENDDIKSKQVSSLQSYQTLQNDTNTLTVSHSEESPVVHHIPVITSHRSSSFQREPSCQNVVKPSIPENEKSLSVVETDDINSNQISLQLEQTLQNDTDTLIMSDSEESPVVHPIPVLTSNRNSTFQMEPSFQNVEEAKIPENVQSVFVAKENDDVNSKQMSSLQSEQTPQNDTNTLIMPDSEESSVVYRIPVITSNRNSPFQMEPSCKNMEKPKLIENVESLSVTEERGDNEKQRSSLVSEQLLLNDREKLETSDNERNSPVKSFVENLNSGDGSSQLETKIATEGNYSGMPRDSEATGQNMKRLLNERELLVTSDNKWSTPVKSSVENLHSGDENSRLETENTKENYSDMPRDSEATDQNMKRLLNDSELLGSSGNKQSTPVKSPVENFNLGDARSQLETEIATEENYSDMPCDSEATDQNTKLLLNNREKLEPSDSNEITSVKSSVENLHSGDESSRLETEIATEGNYSDMPCDSEATDQNMKLLLNNREKLEPSDSKEITSVQLSVDNLNSGGQNSRLETENTKENSDMPHELEATEQDIKRLLNDGEKLGISDNEQSIPVKSSVENLHSGDENSQLETENTKGNYSDIARDSETTDQDTAQQSQGKKRKNKKRKKSKKETETSSENRSSSKMEGSEVAGLKISSHPEKQSLQTIEKPMDTEESLPVPSIDDVLRAYLFLQEKFKDSFRSVCDLLSMHISI